LGILVSLQFLIFLRIIWPPFLKILALYLRQGLQFLSELGLVQLEQAGLEQLEVLELVSAVEQQKVAAGRVPYSFGASASAVDTSTVEAAVDTSWAATWFGAC
jgi:hypothetical protein